MKRVLPILLVLLLTIASTGCITINLPPKDTEVPTEEPVVTEAPTEEPVITEAPTEVPTEEPVETKDPFAITGFEDYCEVLEIEEDNILDLDFDGLEDTVFIERSKADDYDDRFDITVTLGCDPFGHYTYTVDYCYDFYAWVVDCDPEDSRLEILFTFAQDSDDWTSVALRVKDEGGEIAEFESGFTISSSLETIFHTQGGFMIYEETYIIGTSTLIAFMTVTSDGFQLVDEDYTYWGYPENWEKLLKNFEVRILNDDGTLGDTVVVKKGAYIKPYMTDMTTYVIIELDDGRMAKVNVELHEWPDYDDWGIYLNGVNQDELFDVIYAD